MRIDTQYKQYLQKNLLEVTSDGFVVRGPCMQVGP
jgi:hypothetical protein